MPQYNPIFYLANRNGIPRIESQSVTVNGTTDVAFAFSNDISFSRNFGGLVLVKSINGGTRPLVGYNGAPVTVGDISGTGIYLVYYENGMLQLVKAV